MQVKSSSLAQLRSQSQNPNQLRVASYLKEQASRINSRVLSALAMRVADDPFKKVKKMITVLFSNRTEEVNEGGQCGGHILDTVIVIYIRYSTFELIALPDIIYSANATTKNNGE